GRGVETPLDRRGVPHYGSHRDRGSGRAELSRWNGRCLNTVRRQSSLAVRGWHMSSRVQIYALLAMSMLFLLYGVIGGLVATFVLADSRLSAFTSPFTLVGLLGLLSASAISQLSERLERRERSKDNGGHERSGGGGVGSSDRA